jgi:hypothetical protein
MRAASGWAPGGGWNRGSGFAPPAFIRVVGMSESRHMTVENERIADGSVE